MMLTEEEAKTRRCQEGFAASPGAAREPVTEYAAVNHAIAPAMHSIGGMGTSVAVATTAEPKTAPIFCLASHCMAWRWAGWCDDTGIWETEADHTPREHVGYCGKAGAP